jgi:PPOX class probable F420-dependent enzyme
VLDESTEFGARAARRLRDEIIGWLTTVTPSGAPAPVPVWFLWDGEASVLLYSQPGKPKLQHIESNARCTLNLDGNGRGGDIVVVHGTLRVTDDPPADQVPGYVAKYAERIAELNWTPESFAADYSVPMRIDVARIAGH